MADAQIEIEVVLADGSVAKGFGKIIQDGNAAANSVEASFKRLKQEVVGLVAAYATFSTVKDFLLSSVKAAADQEASINKINTALRMAGTYTESASMAFQNMANEIQRTTTIEDDQVLSLAALARNMTKTNEEALALTKASIDLGAATGKGADAALQALNGTLSGTPGRLAKVIPELSNFSAEQLKAGAAIQYVNERFGGAAASELNTYSGRVKNLGNVFGDFQEEIGSLVTTSPAVLALFKFVSDKIIEASKAVAKFGASGDVIKPLLLYMIDLASVINFGVVGSLETLYRAGLVAFNGLLTLIQGFIFGIATAAAKIVGFFAPNSELKQNLDAFAQSSGDVLDQFANSTAESFNKINDLSFTEGIQSQIEQARLAVSSATAQMKTEIADLSTSGTAEISTLGSYFTEFQRGFSEASKKIAEDAKKSVADAGGAAFRSLAAGVSTGMAAIGKTLVKGGDIFQAFAGAMLGALGQAAMQMGATYFLIGLARLLTGDPVGAQLMGVGAALSVLGGALMALGEGSNSTAAASGSYAAGGGSAGTPSDIGREASPAENMKNEKAQTVTVNIQGDVLDSTETGLRIVELISDAFNGQGAKVVTV